MARVTLTLKAILTAALVALPFAASHAANDKSRTYKDWSVSASGEAADDNAQVTCTMEADKLDGILLMSIQHQGPAADASDRRSTITLLKGLGEDGQPMALAPEDLASTWSFDGKTRISTILDWDFTDGRNNFTVPSAHTGPILAAMAKGNTLTLTVAAFGEETVSLAGFSAVYRKMSDWCQFSLDGVL
ncbi:MAG: hypothetical protein AAGD34_03090 [Pseudomonadota bacterium]